MLRAGLCGACRRAREIVSSRGSRFVLCDRSRMDPAYPRYPVLPRLTCDGFDPVTAAHPGPMTADTPARTADIRIRQAGPADVPTILKFIVQLAAYERLSAEVHATEEALHETLFGARPAAEVLLAALDGADVGFALFFETYSTFLARRGMHLEDLFVAEHARGRGVGRALLVRLARESVARGYGRLEWSVLTWNRPAIAFYQRLGAFSLDGWETFRLHREGLDALATDTRTSHAPHD
jgi:GNAT superfamily N-acetyltransferase